MGATDQAWGELLSYLYVFSNLKSKLFVFEILLKKYLMLSNTFYTLIPI